MNIYKIFYVMLSLCILAMPQSISYAQGLPMATTNAHLRVETDPSVWGGKLLESLRSEDFLRARLAAKGLRLVMMNDRKQNGWPTSSIASLREQTTRKRLGDKMYYEIVQLGTNVLSNHSATDEALLGAVAALTEGLSYTGIEDRLLKYVHDFKCSSSTNLSSRILDRRLIVYSVGLAFLDNTNACQCLVENIRSKVSFDDKKDSIDALLYLSRFKIDDSLIIILRDGRVDVQTYVYSSLIGVPGDKSAAYTLAAETAVKVANDYRINMRFDNNDTSNLLDAALYFLYEGNASNKLSEHDKQAYKTSAISLFNPSDAALFSATTMHASVLFSDGEANMIRQMLSYNDPKVQLHGLRALASCSTTALNEFTDQLDALSHSTDVRIRNTSQIIGKKLRAWKLRGERENVSP